MHPLENSIKQLAGILPVLEKAVQHEAEPGVDLCLVDPGAEQKIADHEMDHVNERRGRRFECRQLLERRISLASEAQDLAVKMLLAREMPEQQRFGYTRRLGKLFGGRAGKPFARKQRHRRDDDRLSPFLAI